MATTKATAAKPFVDEVFELDRETKNTLRFQEQPSNGLPPRVGTQYIQKWALDGQTPQKVRVTITPA